MAGTLLEIDSGLFFKDDFDRPNSNVVGNGWIEAELVATEIQILNNQIFENSAGGADRYAFQAMIGSERSGVLVQAICKYEFSGASGSGTGVWGRGRAMDTPLFSGYLLLPNAPSNQWELYSGAGGVWTLRASFIEPGGLVNTAFHQTRLRIYGGVDGGMGANLEVEGYGTDGPTGELALKVSYSDPAEVFGEWPACRFWGNLAASDNFFACRDKITVSGVPTGWKVQVDSRTPVVSVGADIDIDISTWELPWTTIKILDTSNVEQDSITPPPAFSGAGGGGFGGVYQFIQTATLIRTKEGRVTHDSFSRMASSTVGNGWFERESFITDMGMGGSATVIHTNVGRSSEFYKSSPMVDDLGGLSDQGTGLGPRFNPAADLMMHLNMGMIHPDTGGGPALWVRWTGSPSFSLDEYYHCSYDGFQNRWAIFKKFGNISSPTLQAQFAEVILEGGWLSVRLVVEHDVEGPSATQRTVSCYGITSISTGGDLSGDLTLKTQWVDAAPATWVPNFAGTYDAHDNYAGFFGWWENQFDMAFICGTYLKVVGVPAGWKVQIDSRTPVVSAGADIIIPVRDWALPYQTIKILDAADVIRLQETPPQPEPQFPFGGFGGDTWEIFGTFAPEGPEDLACECQSDQIAINLTWTDIAGAEDAYRVYRSEDPFSFGSFGRGFSPDFDFCSFVQIGGDLPPDTEEYLDTEVESNTRYYYVVFAVTGGVLSAPSNIVTCRTKLWTDCAPSGTFDWDKYKEPSVCLREFLVFVGSSGITFEDDFDRSDRGLDGDNGWTERVEPGFSNEWFIVSQEAECGDNDDNILYQTLAGSGDKSLIINADVVGRLVGQVNGYGLMFRQFERGYNPGLSKYDEDMYLTQATFPVTTRVTIWSKKGIDFTKEAEIDPGAFDVPFNLEGRLEDDGTDVTLRLFKDSVEEIVWTDLAPGVIRETPNHDNLGYRVNNPAAGDNFTVTQTDIIIQDVPAGYSASADNVTYFPEVGGTIVLPASGADQLFLKNDEGVVVFIQDGPIPSLAIYRYDSQLGGF